MSSKLTNLKENKMSSNQVNSQNMKLEVLSASHSHRSVNRKGGKIAQLWQSVRSRTHSRQVISLPDSNLLASWSD